MQLNRSGGGEMGRSQIASQEPRFYSPRSMAQRLKVLISAYACEPGKGSEPEVGWQWALQMARFHDVTVLTRTNNRSAIEAGLEKIKGQQAVPQFVYHDLNSVFVNAKRRL